MESPDQKFIRELQNNANEIERYRILLTKCMNRISNLELQKNQILTNYIKSRNLQEKPVNHPGLAFHQNSMTDSYSTLHQVLTSLPSSNNGEFQSLATSSNISIGVLNKEETSSGTSTGSPNENDNPLILRLEKGNEKRKQLAIKRELLPEQNKVDSGMTSNCCTSNSSRTRTPCQLSLKLPKLNDSQLQNVQHNVLDKLLFAATQNQKEFRPNYLKLENNGPHQSKIPRMSTPTDVPLNMVHPNPGSQNFQPLSKRSIFQFNKQIRKIDPKNRNESQVKQEVDLYMRKNSISNVYDCTFPNCNNNDGKGFSLKLRCKTHIEGEHLQIRYQCPYCSFQTARDDNLPKHIDKKHRGLIEWQQNFR